MMILLPSHRDRANNSMYYNLAENGQVDATASCFLYSLSQTKLLTT